MRTVLKIAIVVVLGLTVLIVGCVAVLGAGIEEADQEQRRQGITLAQFREVEQGTGQSVIERRFGPPEDAQEFENQVPEIQDQPARSSCIYYPERGKGIGEGRSFQFCFDEGRLTSKNAY